MGTNGEMGGGRIMEGEKDREGFGETLREIARGEGGLEGGKEWMDGGGRDGRREGGGKD